MLKSRVLVMAGLLGVAGGSLVLAPRPALAQDQPAEAPVMKKADPTSQAIFESLMGSIEDDTYADFQALGDEAVKTQLTRQIFEKVVAQVAPRLKTGYDSDYLGTMNKLGFKVHLFKLVFKDGGDDMLCELSIKDQRVGGFFLR